MDGNGLYKDETMNKSKGRDKRVLVGMSGGVDSSAVCMLLQEQGYDVVGVTLRMWDLPKHFPHSGQMEPVHVLEARTLAEKLGIEHHSMDVRSDFRQTVIQDFIEEYMQGRTPNPCVMCNLYFKWRYLLEAADRYGCKWVATGHYARIGRENDMFYLLKGIDPLKDQSYFLWRLGQKELSRTLFPLGEMKKEDIKKYVLSKGFKEKVEKKESMEICFIEDDYREFLKQEVPELPEKVNGGFFVDKEGRKIGRHKGFPFYTVGQRKGLEIALGHPAYLSKINARKNTIRLGDKTELLAKEMLVRDVLLPIPLSPEEEISVRIRYRSAALPATLCSVGEGRAIVRFCDEASAVTPGQSAVFYRGDRVLGGSIIDDQRYLKKYI